jgi:hypothetical protein
MSKLGSNPIASTSFLALLTLALVACSSGGRTPDHCTPGSVVSCACPAGASGTQTCDTSGTLGACVGCAVSGDAGTVFRDGGTSVRCGDGVCSPSESCTSCSVDCGACRCSVSPGSACTSPSMCCGDNAHTVQGTCANLDDGNGPICRGLCTIDSECTSGCCYQLTDGTGACGAAGLGLQGSACSSSTCCGPGLSCVGGSCQPPVCLQAGAPCSSSSDCCGNSVCADVYGTGYVCHAHCTHGSDCSSGCCYVLTDGTGACAATLLAPRGAWCDSSQCCEGALLCSGGACY